MATTLTPPAPSSPASSPAPSSAPDTVNSAAELSASFVPGSEAAPAEAQPPSDLEEPLPPDAEGGEDVNYDELNDQGNPDEQHPEAGAEEPAAEEPAAAAAELPEGVRKGKDRNGKEGYWLQPNRYEAFHQAHVALRNAAEMIGEDLTPEALDVRNRAYWAQEKLYGDMLSGDPKAQAAVIQHFLSEAKRAVQEGEVGANPMVSFTRELYSHLQREDPDAYAILRSQAANDLVDEMYAEAAQRKSEALWLSAQHFDNILGRTWKPITEMANFATTDPVAQLRAENEQLRQQISGSTRQSEAQQLRQWQGGVNEQINQSLIRDAIDPALAPVKEAYAKFPDSLRGIAERLHSHVTASFREDAAFKDRLSTLLLAARRAPSEQVRAQIAQQIVNLHSNKARMVIESVRPQILREAAERLKARSDATHQRHRAAQTERAPAGGGMPVRQSLGPSPGMDFESATPEKFAKSLEGLFR